MTVRIAMWSGPRSLSTALMRSFDARGDCRVVDEPLYAAYLAATGLDHPARDEILASQARDWPAALAALEPRHGAPLQYEKHMAQHLLPGVALAALSEARHAVLIRDPAAVAVSYARVRAAPVPDDLGYPQQRRLVDWISGDLGRVPVVVDSDDLLADPPGMLRALCEALDVPWTERMLAWAPGPRPTDGVWAPHWYSAVERSTGFGPRPPAPGPVPEHLRDVVEAVGPHYRHLHALRLRPGAPAQGRESPTTRR